MSTCPQGYISLSNRRRNEIRTHAVHMCHLSLTHARLFFYYLLIFLPLICFAILCVPVFLSTLWNKCKLTRWQCRPCSVCFSPCSSQAVPLKIIEP